jgi:AAA family ATP:ADP antiporter
VEAEAGTREGRAARGAEALLARVVPLRAGEGRAVAWAFAYFFALLASFYVLRPVREEMGIRGGVDKLQWLFTATFLVMLGAVPVYGALVARVPRSRAIPAVYAFFLSNVLAFWALLRLGIAPVGVARAFFVWLSVFNLFVVAVFWSFMADLFSSEQGKRLFGFVAAGGSAGALAGSALTGTLVHVVGVANLFGVAAALLAASILCAGRLGAWARAREVPRIDAATPAAGPPPSSRGGGAPVGGGPFAGVSTVLASRYLGAIAVQILLFSLASTFLYFQQARIVARALPDSARRTALFATVDFAVNVGSLFVQGLASGRLALAFGLGPALASVPALGVVGFAALAAAPSLWTIALLQSVRRTVHYGLERPARDVLYTVVSREEKYKSKGFLDTVVYRGGDALAGWAYAGLASFGLAPTALAAAGVPVAALSLAVAVWLARRHARLEA